MLGRPWCGSFSDHRPVKRPSSFTIDRSRIGLGSTHKVTIVIAGSGDGSDLHATTQCSPMILSIMPFFNFPSPSETKIHDQVFEARRLSSQRKRRLELLHALTTGSSGLEALVGHKDILLELNDATSGALIVGRDVHPIGDAPDRAHIISLDNWLDERLSDGLLKTMQLPRLFTPAQEFAEKAAGLLAIDLPGNGRDKILWFKPQIHPVMSSPAGRAPRMSMTYDPRQMRFTSAPWTAEEVETAWRLRQDIHAALFRK
jgi:light-regulated signal transduction histidine kinase (bacteriophytochrome)